MMNKTKILNINCDWLAVKNECRNTVNKEFSETQPTHKFIEDVMISEHSPIRLARIRFRWEGIKYWISVHFSRHWLGWEKFISTQRTDRTGVNREELKQDSPVNMDVEANPQALINVARFRLCYGCPSVQTRRYAEDLKRTIHDSGQEEIAFAMQRNCIYRAGCPEFNPCPYWENFCERHKEQNLLDIRTRYKLADEEFYNEKN